MIMRKTGFMLSVSTWDHDDPVWSQKVELAWTTDRDTIVAMLVAAMRSNGVIHAGFEGVPIAAVEELVRWVVAGEAPEPLDDEGGAA